MFNLRFHSYIHLVFENSRCFAANAFLQSTWKRSSHLEVFHGDAVLINFTRGRRALSTLLGKFHVTGTQLTPSPVFSIDFANLLHSQNQLKILTTAFVCFCQKLITWMKKQTYTRQANKWGSNKLLDNYSLISINSEQ